MLKIHITHCSGFGVTACNSNSYLGKLYIHSHRSLQKQEIEDMEKKNAKKKKNLKKNKNLLLQFLEKKKQ